MDWYIVIKKINGRAYYYRQKTWREGKRVRTRSEYIGPVHVGVMPDREAPSVTLQPGVLDESSVRSAFDAVIGEQAASWTHHWSEDRKGPSLVHKDERIEEVLKDLKVSWTHNATGAYYRPSTQEVNIPPEECFVERDGQSATQAYYVVTFHEIVHWTMDSSRAHRPRAMGGKVAYAREELVAELGAAILMEHFGLKLGCPGRHALYFQTWLGRTPSRKFSLSYAKREAERAVRFILEKGHVTLQGANREAA
jgi:antirestriction protein ArdC